MESKFKITYKKNKRFKTKVKWYKLGQRRCHCCGIQLNWHPGFKNSASVEHLVPASKGGTFHFENLIITCSSCNSSRGSKDWIGFVNDNQFPKSRWLISKYLTAVDFYRNETKQRKTKKVHSCIFKNADAYMRKEAA